MLVQKSSKNVQTIKMKNFEICPIEGATISLAPRLYMRKGGDTNDFNDGTK